MEEAWSELFLLCAIQWSMPMETSPLLMTHEAAQPQMSNIKTGSEYPDNRLLQEIFRRFKHTQVDPAEFACLKAIALFKPGITLRLEKTNCFCHTKYKVLNILHMYFQLEVLLYAFSLITFCQRPEA